jgi:hypothetical protein
MTPLPEDDSLGDRASPTPPHRSPSPADRTTPNPDGEGTTDASGDANKTVSKRQKRKRGHQDEDLEASNTEVRSQVKAAKKGENPQTLTGKINL